MNRSIDSVMPSPMATSRVLRSPGNARCKRAFSLRLPRIRKTR
ncbi:MAG: hypothetical protein ACK55Z_33875 [bacterium]